MTLGASAQLKVRGSRIFENGDRLSMDEVMLRFSDVNGENRVPDYLDCRTGYKVGLGLTWGGLAVMSAGGMTAVLGVFQAIVTIPLLAKDKAYAAKLNTITEIGAFTGLAGAALMVAGIPVACVYRHRIKNIAIEYNVAAASDRAEVSFGLQSHGMGLAIAF